MAPRPNSFRAKRPLRGPAAFFCILFFGIHSVYGAAAGAAGDTKIPSKTILVLPFDFVDTSILELPNRHSLPADIARVRRTTRIARRAIDKLPEFRVTPSGPVHSAIQQAQNTYRYLYQCNGCDVDIGRKAGADLVMTGWVQKVSNLILNVNATIRSVATGQEVAGGSVSMRGDTNESWRDSTRYLIKHPLLTNYRAIEADIAKKRTARGHGSR